MEQALRPHRGGTVLALGILSLVALFIIPLGTVLALGILSLAAGLFLIPLGIVAWIMGSRDLRRMDAGQVDPGGRSLTQIGRLFGMGSLFVWLLAAGCVATTMFGRTLGAETMYSMGDGTRTVAKYFPRPEGDPGSSVKELEYHEVQRPNGAWAKEGLAVRWTREGQKLEEGSYRDGKREGEWTFWNEDGSIDLVRSGIYENDVRVQEGARPAGY
jgi:hypothetical protein